LENMNLKKLEAEKKEKEKAIIEQSYKGKKK
jgi:hypothetical protein